SRLAFQSFRVIREDLAILLSHARLLKSLWCWLSITMPNIDSCSRLKFKMSSTFLWSTSRLFFVMTFSSECNERRLAVRFVDPFAASHKVASVGLGDR